MTNHNLEQVLASAAGLLEASQLYLFYLVADDARLECIAAKGNEVCKNGLLSITDNRLLSQIDKNKSLFVYDSDILWTDGRRAFTAANDIRIAPVWMGDELQGCMIWCGGQSEFQGISGDYMPVFLAQQALMHYQQQHTMVKAQQREEQLIKIQSLIITALGAGDINSLLRIISEGMIENCSAKQCVVFLWDEDLQCPLSMTASGPQRYGLPNIESEDCIPAAIRSMLNSGRSQRMQHFFEQNPEFESLKQYDLTPGLILPMILRGTWLGVFLLVFEKESQVCDIRLEAWDEVVEQLVLAVAHFKILESERQRNVEFEALRLANLSLTSSLDLGQVLDAILEQILELFSADDAHVFLYENEELSFGAARWARDKGNVPYSAPRKQGLTYMVARSARRIIVEDVNQHPLFSEWNWGGAIVGMPLNVGERVLGVMNVAFDEPHKFLQSEIRVLEMLADQAAIALGNARLYERLDAERKQVNLLYNVAREVSSSLDPMVIINNALELMTGFFIESIAMVFHFEKEVQSLSLVAANFGTNRPPRDFSPKLTFIIGEGLESHVALNKEMIHVKDVSKDERWLETANQPEGVRSALSAPVLVGNDLYAVISLMSKGNFTPEQRDLFLVITKQIGLALSNAEQYQLVQRQLRERELIQQVTQVINQRLELDPMLKEIVEKIHDLVQVPLVEIYLRDGDRLLLKAQHGVYENREMELDLDRGVVGRAARTKDLVYVQDTAADPDYFDGVIHAVREIAVPIMHKDEVIAVLNAEESKPDYLDISMTRLFRLLADQISVAIERAGLYGRLQDQAADLEQQVVARTAQLNEALKQVREADQLKSQFVSDVSHELRTPLTNIQLYLELIEAGKSERFPLYMETLHRETVRLTALIESLLSVSRLDAGTTSIENRLQDLNLFIHSLVEDRRRLFDEKSVSLEFLPDDSLDHVWFDKALLSRVIANLMTNALQYTDTSGSVSIETRICTSAGNEFVTIEVTDTGRGIAEEEQEKIFRRFYRGQASRETNTPGTGLGLAICREITHRHQGDVTVRSQLGKGSSFTVWLPMKKPELIS